MSNRKMYDNNLSSNTRTLENFQTCNIVVLGTPATNTPQAEIVDLQIRHRDELQALFSSTDASLVFRVAWSLALKCYTGSNHVSFGYQEALASGEPIKSSVFRAFIDENLTLAATIHYMRPLIVFESTRTEGMNAHTYNTCLVVIEGPEVADGLGSQDSAPSPNAIPHETCDLSVEVHVARHSTRVFLQGPSGRMNRDQLLNIAGTLNSILSQLSTEANTGIRDLNFLSDRDKEQIHKWNDTPIEEVKKCIHEVVHDNALAKPNAEAICFAGGSISYSELDKHSTQLAAYLIDSNVRHGDFVPLCFEKSPWNVVAMIAVMKAGAAFTPLDPSAPIGRIKMLLGKVNAKIILCSNRYSSILKEGDCQTIAIDGSLIGSLPENKSPLPHIDTTSLAYLIWTSGTTGEPKGTMIEHLSYCSGAKAHGPAMLMKETSRVLQFAAHTFDASLVEVLTTLMVGGVVCLPTDEDRLNDIAATIKQLRVNWAVLTPSFVDFMNPDDVPGLETLVLAGEAMNRRQLERWSHINLVNGYGPSEASVAAVVNFSVTAATSPTNIGSATGVYIWVADSTDHEKLVPIGSIGELIIQGPSVARGYHNDANRTAQSFLESAAWLDKEHHQWRLYKTGDLVRQNPDGTLEFVGRKDTQVKVHGQRVELGEIEHHLTRHALIAHALVIFPKVGVFKDRLISVLRLTNAAPKRAGNVPLKILDGHAEEREAIHDFLVAQLPVHMVPTMLVIVESLPFLASGKLDRKAIATWIECMDEDVYRQLVEVPVAVNEEDPTTVASTEMEAKLRGIWGHVLNLPSTSIALNRSFMSLGGDSITAMQVKGQCGKQKIELGVQEILRSKSISVLAQCAKVLEHKVQHEEILEHSFDLSPIQEMYFMLPDQGKGHFNQSFFLRVTRKITPVDLKFALETIVQRHSMLRARFTKSHDGQAWQQRITSDVEGSYRLRIHSMGGSEERDLAMADSQVSLDVASGPVFAADLFVDTGSRDENEQLLFIVGQHLVIDLVSWRVILEDLEEILLDPGKWSAEKPTSFQSWCQMQMAQCLTLEIEKVLPVSNIPAGDFQYWGMSGRPNTYGLVACETFEIDQETTSVLLNKCHLALRTETVDVLVASLVYSFGKTFEDHASPAIFIEGHGREPSGIAVDLSRTVGWFTTMYPIFVRESQSQIDTLKQVKDFRRKVPDNGRPYFASRCLTKEGADRFQEHWPLEITFNYLGQYQQFEREGALLRPVDAMAGETRGAGGTADVGENTPRFGLFEISAVIVQGKLRFAFTFNHQMKHQQRIRQWISSCHNSLCEMVSVLAERTPEPTPGDYPLMSITYDTLKLLAKEKLPQLAIHSFDEIEDIYPCSSMQEGILISQAKSASFYAVQIICRLDQKLSVDADDDRLARAWQQLVNRHPCLRTVFIQSVSEDDGLYDQVVLRDFTANICDVKCSSEQYALQVLSKRDPAPYGENGHPPHKFTICKTAEGKTFCKLEISHAIMDGGSTSILFRELAAAYEGKLSTAPGPLYSNYIAYLQSQPFDASTEYWKTYLKEVEPSVFPVLNDGIRPQTELHSLRLNFDHSSFLRIRKFCDETSLTFSNVLHTAWALTLRCYTASDDVCFGYLSSVRDAPVPGIEDAVGPFINTIACRVTMASASRLVAVLEQVQKDQMESIPHRTLSLAEVQHGLLLSGTPLFNTALSYRKLPPHHPARDTMVSFSEAAPTYDPTEYPLSINIEASDNNATIELDYWTDYISDGQAENIGSVFLKALENIVRHSDHTVGQLDHFNESHSRQIYDVWNCNMPHTINNCVHSVIEELARELPQAPALCSWDGDLTYAELDKLSSRLAHHLSSVMNIRPEMYVPTCFDKSTWAVVAMLSVLKAGGAVVPLDATHPRAALELRVKDTQAKVVLSSPSRVELFQNMGVNALAVGKQFIENLPHDHSSASSPAMPSNPAFVIFTSGSTGKPKGVVLEHQAIVTTGHATGNAYGFSSKSRVLQFAAYTFDNSLAEIFITLMRGGCVCVPSEHERFNDLAGAINKLNVNFMDITPTVASFLHPSDVPTVKGLSLGGEPLTKENIDTWGNAVSLHCCYGPSECSINSTWNGDLLSSTEPTNIGKSIGSVSWIVDASNHDLLVPIGCVGELLVEGPILARGYLNDPEKTSNAFIVNPAWAGAGHHRMYKTGDLARYNSNGTITYLGRKDFQIKLNGQRIELGEIEHHVKSNLSTDTQSIVELLTLNGNRKALAAFLCTEDSNSTSDTNQLLLPLSDDIRDIASSLQSAITALIPSYMVPTLYIPVTKMPMKSSGKLDRRSLREACKSLSETDAAKYRLAQKSSIRPSTKMEKSLAELWESVLNLEPSTVGADDNFFRMSGDSIGAMKLITAARSKGITLTVASIFQKPKLSDLALYASSIPGSVSGLKAEPKLESFELIPKNVSRNKLIDEVASHCQVEANSIEDIYPCTAIQEGLIALSNKDPGAYVAQNVYQLPPNIDFDRFRQAWQAVFDVEFILKTRIVFTELTGFLQVVVREPMTWQNATSVEDILREKRQLPSHNGGALASYTIIEETAQFVWTAHHAIYDGWCMPILLERVAACYNNRSSVDMEIGRSYPRFIKFLQGVDSSSMDAFWVNKLSDTTAVQFPALPHPAYQVHATSVSTHTAQVNRNSRSGITLPSAIRAAWALTIAFYSGNAEDVVFGETLTGRDAPVDNIENILGPTLATIPTRIQIKHEATVATFLKEVQSLSAAAIPYQYAGIQRIMHVSQDAAFACGFQNLLAINHNANESASELWNLTTPETVGTNFFSYPLTASCQISDESVEFEANFDQGVISSWLVDRILTQFAFLLRKLLLPENSQKSLRDLQTLNPADEGMIQAWNSKPLTTVNRCIHEVIEDQIPKQPTMKPAVYGWDVTFTYRELDNISTRLARLLVHHDVQASLVPICFEKSAWTIVAMLAIFKSGAAFVPLDPTAPISRLRGIVQDSDARLILCSPSYEELCRDLSSQILVVDRHATEALTSVVKELPSVSPQDPAYVIFTSGTTGKPKGAIIHHAALCSSAAAHGPALRMNSDSRVLQFASYTFDASILEIFTCMSLGGCVCVPSDDSRLNDIASVINNMDITWAMLTPSFVQLMQPSTVPNLRALTLVGEAMSQSHLTTWADRLYLMNAYGPSETAIVTTVNCQMTTVTDPRNMGRAVGAHAWVVDVINYNRLAPVGSIGELMIEGPILGKGYLKNDTKTKDVFVERPAWGHGHLRRQLYLTGDLVKYNVEGELTFCGRRDTQTKIHGQRIEMGEVEHHLREDISVRHVFAAVPKAGLCKGRLVAVLSLEEDSTSTAAAADLKLVTHDGSQFSLSGIRGRLCEHLPAYMIPSTWAILQSLPLQRSGKLDRRSIEQYLESMDMDTFQQISNIAGTEHDAPATPVESQLQEILGVVLNLPPRQIGLHQSFLHLGGDSISAMQVMSSCRSHGLGVTVKDIIQSKSISQLALLVTLPKEIVHQIEVANKPFDLSPIQKLFFECVGQKVGHFNQSILVRLNKPTSAEKLRVALDSIVTTHSILRARFNKNETGTWQQYITDAPQAYYFQVHQESEGDIPIILKRSQELLDISSGPVFVADLVETKNEKQILSVVAHHLVIDVVSWRIILQDLEDLLSTNLGTLQAPLQFQTWSRLQSEQAHSGRPKAITLLEDVPIADLSYWEMADKPNLSGDVSEDGFELDMESSLALLARCHESMQTEPVDVFLATILQSFHKVFPDRSSVPTIYNEGHGREPWEDSKLDLSQTVGWFTTMCPIFLPTNLNGEADLMNTIRWVKDLRRRIPDKGRPYFAHRLLTEDGKQRFTKHWPMEVVFNYLGKLQQLERKDAIFQPVETISSTQFDVGHDVPRFALFEISASVTSGIVRMSFSYNKTMKRQAKIRRWIIECQRTLQDAIKRLVQMKPEQTLCDFPRLPLAYNGILKLVEKLPKLGVRSLGEVEDVYPSSPIQQGMLLAQLKIPELYAYSCIFEARASDGKEVDARHLAEAWQMVVDQHSILRTIFIESVSHEGLNDQVVLKDRTARVSWFDSPRSEVTSVFGQQSPINFRDVQPPHRLSLCKTEEGLFCKLEMSHTICDGTSVPILLRDLSISYAHLISKRGEADASLSPKTEMRMSKPRYADYVSYIQERSVDADVTYWKSYLSGIEPCHMPTLNDGNKLAKELRSRTLPFNNTEGLKTFCNQNGVTLSNVMQLTWAIILRIYTGSDEVCFGYVSSGRNAPIPGIQDEAIGAFINMLTCRLNLSSSTRLRQAVQTVQTDYINGMTHQRASLATVQHELQLSSTSLFNTAFTFQKRKRNQQTSSSPISFDVIEAQDPSEFDITVNVEAFESDVEVNFSYWTTTLAEPQAENMAYTFEHVLEMIISGDSVERTVSDLDLVSASSLKQIMKWNASLPPSVERCVHDMIRDQGLKQPPPAHAICAWDGNFTWSELDALSTQLSLHLIEIGVETNTYVPLCFEKSAWNVIAMISVLKSGAAFVPLDFTHPEGRLKNFIEDVQGDLVLCSAQNYDKISSAAKRALVVDQQLVYRLKYNPHNTIVPTISVDDPAYIIFTSGTTGRPKGTIIEHAAFCTGAIEHTKAMRMGPDSRVFQFASHTFDASVMEILSSLIVGATVCIPSEQDRMNDIPGAIRRMGVTWTLLTPSVASTLSPKSVPCLKTLVTGGEKMSSDHIARWKAQCCLINAYGPTETSVIATTSTKVDQHGNKLNNDSSNIGRGVGARVWVVGPNNYQRLVPVGGIGELVVEGRTVARGYLNNPEKTADAFISDPAWLRSVEPRGRIYRTGDLVRYNFDGTLCFVNRKDTQIKLNGQRIELGEIEQNVKIILPDDVQSAVDLVSPLNRTSKALAVFFTVAATDLKSESSIDEILLPMAESARKVAKNLDSSLAVVLPTYMCPSFYIPVIRMPWTSSGKMDRGRLRAIVANLPKDMVAPYRLQVSQASIAKAPTTAAEKTLQLLWESVLHISPPGSVGSEDSFFRLGGDSVTAMRLVGAARAEGLSLTVIEIFRNPRLCDMAQICTALVVEEEQQQLSFTLISTGEPIDSIVDEVSSHCKVEKNSVLDVYPCSLLQEGLLTLSIKQPGAYVAKNVFKLPADIDIERFKMVWNQTIEDVDILRTRIVHMRSGNFLQALLEHEPVQWHSASSLEKLDVAEIRLPATNGGFLARYTILADGETDELFFVWHIHHALYDGWSLPMVLKRVETAYLDSTARFSKNSYSLFIRYLASVDEGASDEFWKTRLLEASPLQFPQDQHIANDRAFNNQTLTHTTPISRNTAGMGITVPTIIRAAWSLVVAAYSGSNDVIFGEIFAGRDIAVEGITEIIGPTITTVPTRIVIDRKRSVTGFLQGIQKLATDIIPFQHAGLQRIKRINQDTELACDFRNLLVIQTAEEEIEQGLLSFQGTGVASNFFTYPLVLECKGGLDKIEILAHYEDAVMPGWQVQRLLFQMDNVLQQLSNIPKFGTSAKLNAVEILSPEDRHAISSWNSYQPDFVDACIHEEFEKMALSRPKAQAVCAWDGSLTYEELRDHAARLAQHLSTMGIGPENFVPVCMDKSLWAVVAILGILMSGGAYVPLDPTAPFARQQEMMKDVNAKHLICSPNHAHRFSAVAMKVVSIDDTMKARLALSGSPTLESARARSHNAAYAIFTSGSTGRPKGTVVEHKAISTSSAAMTKMLLMKPTSRVFQFASFTFDVSVLEVLTALSCGACVCMPSEDMRTRDVGEAISLLEATWAFLTPSVANIINPSSVPRLDVLVCGGEAMSIENVIKWASKVTLVNGYGPTEASVIAVGNPLVSQGRDPSNIGHALPSGYAWVADPLDHNIISPIGCVGELLLDGPLLAREYINDPAKTAEVFIKRPSWAANFTTCSILPTSRMYKTGDLVKYNEDGSLKFIGRKDNQVKLNGQRLELGEIEHSLGRDSDIQHAFVSLPKAGPFRKRLVAVISLTALTGTMITKGSCELIQEGPQGAAARAHVTKIRNRLSEILSAYMVPTSWLVVASIPLLPSGKLDRRSVDSWLHSIDDKTYERILEAEDEEDTSIPATETALLLQKNFSRVLNLTLQRTKLGQSFLSLGGDSISAMQVMALCRKEKLNFSLSEVLRSKSIHQLASIARYEDEVQHQEEVLDQVFDLSPIQQLYFESQISNTFVGSGRFNQSFSLQITKHIEPQQVKSALHKIVGHHSMLRSRFVKNATGAWQQLLTRDVQNSFDFQVHDIADLDHLIQSVGQAQSSLDLVKGPVFTARFYILPDLRQMVFLAAHHLVIDMVSWRIIMQDLEELLSTRSLLSDKPLSFQVWCSMQAEHTLKPSPSQTSGTLPFQFPAMDMRYWGIEKGTNKYGDVISETFSLSNAVSDLLLDQSNKALRTEPVELFMAAISHSFGRVFLDRKTPAIFNEGHGREPWDSSIDISRTVGWFTTIFPVHVEIDTDEDDVVDTVRRTKDVRRSVPSSGREYFARQFLSTADKSQSRDRGQPMEIIFNYLGKMQQLEHNDSLLRQFDYPEDEETSKTIADVGPQANRLALFEISAVVVRDKIQFSFLYNRNVRQQKSIRRWVHECQETLQEIAERLANLTGSTILTLSDFPLLPISYDGLQKIITRSLPQVGINQDDIEDIYPCAPLQEGLLISQLKNPSLYHFHAVFEVHPAQDGIPVDGDELAKAWQKVVDRHAALRTVFADSVHKGDVFNQIVVKNVDSGVMTVRCDEVDALDTLSKMSILDANYTKQPRLPHQATICQTSNGKVYFKGEVNHAVIDGASANIMLNDLAAAYHGRLPEGPGPLYSDYVSYIKRLPAGASIKFWKTYLAGAKACTFPVLNKDFTGTRTLGSIAMDFNRFPELHELCRKMSLTLANVMQAAWGFVLRHYTKSEDICFGYLTSGRDVPVKGVQSTIGAFINMLVCRVKFQPQSTIKGVFDGVQNDYLQSLEHQHCSLAQVQHDLMGGKALFNTAVSIQSEGPFNGHEATSISFDPVAAHDPSEYAATLNIRTVRGDEGVLIRYWTDVMAPEQAEELGSMLARVMEAFINKPHQLVEDLYLSKKAAEPVIAGQPPPQQVLQAQPQLVASETQLRTIVSECVREIMEQMFKSGALVKNDQQNMGNTISNTINSTVQIATQQTIQPMIDYSQLAMEPLRPQFNRTRSTSTIESIMQLGGIEQKLLSVWSELLEISKDTIKKDDSFFSLGGDSIIAMQMVGMARDEDLALTVANVFRHPTFADMAAVIRMAEEAQTPQSISDPKGYLEAREARSQAIQNALYQRYSLIDTADVDTFLRDNICPKVRAFRGGIMDVFPVTDFQALAVTGTLMESKWMLNYFYLEGAGDLDLKRLKRSITRVVDSFEILRTVFVPHGNRFFQAVMRKVLPSFSVHQTNDLAEFTLGLQQKDRENGPELGDSYLQFTVAKQTGTKRHRIIMRMSHAQYDGVSFPAILEAIQAGYKGQPISPTPAFSTYVRDAARNTTDDHYLYWKTLLKGSSMTEVVRRSGPNYRRGMNAPTTLKRVVRISSLASRNITPATVIKGAWSITLAKWAATSDVIFGNVISGRNAAVLGVESMIGPCVNLIPVRVTFRNDWTALDLLRSIQDQQVAAMPYESLGFREIIKNCSSWPDWTNFSTVCQHQNIQRQTEVQLGGIEYALGAVGSQEDFVDLTVFSTPLNNDEIEISLIFTMDSGITHDFAESMFEVLCETSVAFSNNPDIFLPNPKDLSTLLRQTLVEEAKPSDVKLAASLKNLSRQDLIHYSELLKRVWSRILSEKDKPSPSLDLEASFYEMGGDIIGIAQVASLLEQEGMKLRVEDLVDHPIMVEQLALLVAFKKAQKIREMEEFAALTPKTQVEEIQKKGIKKLLGRSVGLARKMRVGKTKGEVEAGN